VDVSEQQASENQKAPVGEGRAARSQGRRRRARKPKPVDLWRPVPQLADPEPIVPADDPTALLRSLGHPPLQGQGTVAEHYMAAVVERAAGLATALAATAGLLAEPTTDE
jgi:hypothetical protein